METSQPSPALAFLVICVIDEGIEVIDGFLRGYHRDTASVAWTVLYPYFLHPFEQIFNTATIYMTIVISVDRLVILYAIQEASCLDALPQLSVINH